MDVDVAVVGGGGAGLSLVLALDRLASDRLASDRLASDRPATHGIAAESGAAACVPAISVAIIDPVRRQANDRTWCFWDHGHNDVEAAVHRVWSAAALVDVRGRERRLDLRGLRYVMVRSADLYALADGAVTRLGAARVTAAVDHIVDGGAADPSGGAGPRAVVRAGGQEIRARWVFDSRPAAPTLRGNTTWLQHFRGWTVRFDRDALDPELPVLMDFSVPQPADGVAFGYVLPTDHRRGLVEYTQFSRSRLQSEQYDAALRAYLSDRWGPAGAPGAYDIEEVEDGTIPMTDAVFARRAGHRVFRLGTAGGATRPSTGYTFAAMQRQAGAVARALVDSAAHGWADGQVPEPPAPHLARHRWMDAVLLRALDRGHAGGAELFTRLFDRNPADRVLRFLDGGTSPAEDLALMSTAPMLAMTRATLGDAMARVHRRLPTL